MKTKLFRALEADKPVIPEEGTLDNTEKAPEALPLDNELPAAPPAAGDAPAEGAPPAEGEPPAEPSAEPPAEPAAPEGGEGEPATGEEPAAEIDPDAIADQAEDANVDLLADQAQADEVKKITVTLENLYEAVQGGEIDTVGQSILAATLGGDGGMKLATESGAAGDYLKAIESQQADAQAALSSLSKTIGQRVTKWYSDTATQLEEVKARIATRAEHLTAELSFSSEIKAGSNLLLGDTPETSVMLACSAVCSNILIAGKIAKAPDLMAADLVGEVSKYFTLKEGTAAPGVTYAANNGIGRDVIEFTIRPIGIKTLVFETDTLSPGEGKADTALNTEQAASLANTTLEQIDNVLVSLKDVIENVDLDNLPIEHLGAVYHHIGTMIATNALFTVAEVATVLNA